MKWTDDMGNVQVRDVDRPKICSDYFKQSNVIDSHNHLRQFEMALKKNGSQRMKIN